MRNRKSNDIRLGSDVLLNTQPQWNEFMHHCQLPSKRKRRNEARSCPSTINFCNILGETELTKNMQFTYLTLIKHAMTSTDSTTSLIDLHKANAVNYKKGRESVCTDVIRTVEGDAPARFPVGQG